MVGESLAAIETSVFVFNVAQRAVVGIFLRDIHVKIGLGRKGGLILHATGWTP